MVDLDVVANGRCYGKEVALVGADHQVASADSTFDNARIDNVRGRGTGSEGADGSRLAVVECFDVTSGQEPGEEGLAAGAAPGLGHDGRGHSRHLAVHEQGAVTGPHAALAAISRDQRASVVRHAHQALCLCEVPICAARWITVAAQ